MRLVVNYRIGAAVAAQEYRVRVQDADSAFDKARHIPGVVSIELHTRARRGRSRLLRRVETSGARFTFSASNQES